MNDRAVYVLWETVSEYNNAGYDVYRGKTKDGAYELLNETRIDPNNNQLYQIKDEMVQAGHTYYYKLVSHDIHGRDTDHGPIYVTVPEPKVSHHLYVRDLPSMGQ